MFHHKNQGTCSTAVHFDIIDGKVYFTSERELDPGTFTEVKILASEEYDIIGEDTYEYSK